MGDIVKTTDTSDKKSTIYKNNCHCDKQKAKHKNNCKSHVNTLNA